MHAEKATQPQKAVQQSLQQISEKNTKRRNQQNVSDKNNFIYSNIQTSMQGNFLHRICIFIIASEITLQQQHCCREE